MAVDPNIALQAGAGIPEPVAPMDMIGKYVGIGNALAANRLTGVQTQAAEQTLNATRQKAISAIALNGLVHTDDRQMYDAIHDGLERAVAAGVIPQEQAARYGQSMMTAQNGGQLRNMVMREGFKALDPTGQIAQIYGTPTMINTGGEAVSGVQAPARMGGGVTPSTSMPMTMGPDGQNQLVSVPVLDAQGNDTGRREQITQAEVARRTGQAATLPRGAGGGAAAPAAPGAPARGFGPEVTGRPPVMTGSLGAMRAPEVAAAAGTEATKATDAAQRVYQAADEARTQKSMLDTMAADLAKIPSTGPGTARQQFLEAFAQKYAGLGITLNPEQLASGEAFQKVARQIAMQQAGTLGVGTDEKLMTALGANPSLDLSKRGNVEILAMLKGNSDAIMAKAQAWDKWRQSGKGPETYNTFQTEFNKTFDPRAFQWHNMITTMTPAERTKYIQALPDKGEALRRSYNKAYSDGLLPQ